MANKLSLIRRALLARLGTITPANGYRTEAGANVQSGWLNELIAQEGASYPLIVVQPAKDQTPGKGPAALRLARGFHVILAVSSQLNDYEDELDEIELDVLEALMPIEGQFPQWGRPHLAGITVGAPERHPPGDGMSPAAVLIPVYLHTVIEGRIP